VPARPRLPGRRSLRVARHLASAGLSELRHAVGAGRRGDRVTVNEATARELLRAASELRGTAVKFLQLLSMESDALPDGLGAELSACCHAVPPMPPGAARDALANALGRPAHEAFAAFNDHAFAAASIGQVHRATSHDGRDVAVKIQYPGVREQIASDVRIIRRIVRRLPDAAYHLQLTNTIAQRLREECDYLGEAERTERFDQLASADLHIPTVDWATTTPRVLTTSFVGGQHIDAWLLSDPSQAARDRAATTLAGIFAAGINRLHAVHADANSGNFLLEQDGRVGLIDFGCVCPLSKEDAATLQGTFSALRRGDTTAAAAFSPRGGLQTAEQAELDALHVAPFRRWLAEAMMAQPLDFSTRDGFVSEGRGHWVGMMTNRAHIGLHPSLFVVGRALFGTWRLLERMAARVDLGKPWADQPVSASEDQQP